MKKLLMVLIVSVGIVQLGFSQDSGEIKVKNSLSGAVVLTGEGGATIGQTDYADIKMNYLLKGSVEYFIESYMKGIFGVKISGATGYFGGKSSYLVPSEFKTSFQLLGAGLSFMYPATDVIYPYISLGVSHMWFTPRDNNDVDLAPTSKIMMWDGQAGVRFMANDNLSVNLMGGLMTGIKDGNQDKLDAHARGENRDWVGSVTLGVSYYIGRQTDDDGDGVSNSKDMCPGTPAGVTVDEFGCPVDSDNDGVADYLDKCPNTPAGAKVDSKGCPIDSDNDGVADYLDKCPNTPAGESVDANGCPLDSDNDGVADNLDKCPGTPAGVSVDKDGCPLDSDGDGVPDYRDKCPNTPKGEKVDADGCSVSKEVAHEVMSSDAYFDFDKATIKNKAYSKLDDISATMKENSTYTAEIVGHTDNIGSEEYNMKLSEKRAQAVANYLASKGVDKSRLTIVPRGESKPVASNKTKAGRAKNRRVDIKINSK